MREQKWVLIFSNTLLFFKLLSLGVSWSLDFEFGFGLALGFELGLQFGFNLRLGLGLGELFCLHPGM